MVSTFKKEIVAIQIKEGPSRLVNDCRDVNYTAWKD